MQHNIIIITPLVHLFIYTNNYKIIFVFVHHKPIYFFIAQLIMGYNLLTCLFGAFQGLNLGEIRGFVTVKYNNNLYVACVLDTFIDTFEIKASFLHPAGPSKSYKCPQLSEQALLLNSDVLTLWILQFIQEFNYKELTILIMLCD